MIPHGSKKSITSLYQSKNNGAVHNDFQRDVYCLFGFPVDNLSLKSTENLLKNNVSACQQIVLSTVNVNWIVTSLKSPEFRAAVLNSDICILDGMPLLILSHCLGLPMREVVSGSSLCEHLLQKGDAQNPLSIFLFGGNSDTAENAFIKINSSAKGLKAVGHCNPGFGSIKTMSENSFIQRINSSSPDILLVALGAHKGVLWIERNRNKLNSHIISHLGATIDFLAGTVKRAPLFFQKTALEWLWRIAKEPSLFRRYLDDGLFLFGELISRFLFFFKYIRLKKRYGQKAGKPIILMSENHDWITLKFGEHFNFPQKAFVQQTFYEVALKKKNIVLDFDKTEFVDSAFLAYLLLLLKHQNRNNRVVKVYNIRNNLQKIFCFNFVTHSLNSLDISIDFN
ncbi:MAG: WecB/TagA/CpsF family glycosyltransferase [Deltaproteobacteria bacterium]|nr:WecB/TagA/CpsF family glycosyltransferase [Deltaproteobacteria bacterium]